MKKAIQALLEKGRFLEVEAEVRYWKDATVNGQKDSDGTLIPCREGNNWKPVIELASGKIINWTQGATAGIHYKVCDAGTYYLLDENKQRIARYNGWYVPNDYLCHGASGHGDYIIFNVDSHGQIQGWRDPGLRPKQWIDVDATPGEDDND